ncbi:hypothetical protein ABW20_dc0108619 [Dactylellina cionopaga]|nr:hypothetical protein ABW20_dc0108619 [Dactylellina cionopaga]
MASSSSSVLATTATTCYDEDAMLALTLQLEELGIEHESRKGKEREGDKTDGQLVLEEYKDTLENLSTFYSDRRMAKSIADAVLQDAPEIVRIVTSENIATRDREQVLRVENLIPTPPTTTLELDDTASVFEDYEQHNALPHYVLEYSSDEEAGPSSRPQAKGVKYFNSPRTECSICGNRVLEVYPAKCVTNHIYCRDCLREYIFKAIKDESMHPPKCCKTKISSESILAVLSATEHEQYKNAGEEGTVCPPDRDTQAFLNTADQNGWRRCIKCQQMIELGTGCYHMTCSCKAEFCYLCGVGWKNCRCVLWDENNLRTEAIARADRDADENEHVPPAVRNQRIREAQQAIEQNHDCEHPGKFERRTVFRKRGYKCDKASAALLGS